MRVIDKQVLAEDRDPASRHHNSAFASLVRCDDGSLLLAHRIGTDKNSADGTLFLWRSRDSGATWQKGGIPFATTPSGRPGEFRPAGLSVLGRGHLGMLATWIDHTDDHSPIINPDTEGLMPIHIGWSESWDNGKAWTPVREICVAPAVQPCGNGAIVVLPGGAWLATFETYKDYVDPAPWSARSFCVISRDQGRTWSRPIEVAQDAQHNVSYWDHHVVPLRDGELVGCLWADDRRKPGHSQILQTRSSDGGRTWAVPRPTGIDGQFADLITLDDGRLMMTYVQRAGEPSIRVRFGSCDGLAWDSEDALVVYSHDTADLDQSSRQSYGEYLHDMSTWSFGWPATLQLKDGTVLVSYYVGRGKHAALRLERLSLDGVGARVTIPKAKQIAKVK